MRNGKKGLFFANGGLYSFGDRLLLGAMAFGLLLFLITILYPLAYAFVSSFNKGLLPVNLVPTQITLTGYIACFNYGFIWTGFLNSVIYTGLGTVIALVVTICCAYPLSLKLRAGGVMTAICMFTMYFDGGLIPTFLWMKELGLYNTLWVMVLPGSLSVYNMIVMRTFFATQIPTEMREAAELDGASEFVFLTRIVLPLSGAIIAVIALYYATSLWSSYFNAMIYLQDRAKMPLANVLRTILMDSESFGSEAGFDMLTAELMEERREVMKYCVIVVATVPMMVVYPFVQKYFVKGVMIGAIKG